MISSSFFILADAAAGGPPQNPLQPLFLIGAMGLFFYAIIYRPQQKRQKELQSLVQNLKTGDKVVTNGGIHGIVSNVKDGPTLMLKVADNVKLEVDKSAITSIDKGSTAATPATTASNS